MHYMKFIFYVLFSSDFDSVDGDLEFLLRKYISWLRGYGIWLCRRRIWYWECGSWLCRCRTWYRECRVYADVDFGYVEEKLDKEDVDLEFSEVGFGYEDLWFNTEYVDVDCGYADA